MPAEHCWLLCSHSNTGVCGFELEMFGFWEGLLSLYQMPGASLGWSFLNCIFDLLVTNQNRVWFKLTFVQFKQPIRSLTFLVGGIYWLMNGDE